MKNVLQYLTSIMISKTFSITPGKLGFRCTSKPDRMGNGDRSFKADGANKYKMDANMKIYSKKVYLRGKLRVNYISKYMCKMN